MVLLTTIGVSIGNFSAALIVIYLSAVIIKQCARYEGEIKTIGIALAFVLLPLLLVTYVLYDGRVYDLFNHQLAMNIDASNWWVVVMKAGQPGEGGSGQTINLLETGVIISLLYIVATLMISVTSTVYVRRKKQGLLSIHRGLFKWGVVLVGCFFCLKIEIGTILLGMGAASIVLGFALKEMLENLFTGMALEMEGTFRRGDWIRLGGDEVVGEVYEKNWRATKIRTLNDESITIPNRVLGAEKIVNYNQPVRPHAMNLYMGTSYNDPPVKVKEVLRTILMREGEVLNSPLPQVRTIEYGDFAITFEMKFWIRDYSRRNFIEDQVMSQVWYAFKLNGIHIPFPIRTLHFKEKDQLAAEEQTIEDDFQSKMAFLQGLPYFRELRGNDYEFMARNAIAKSYPPGDNVVCRGEVGDVLYLVMEGWCEAVLPDRRRPRLERGHYFGEMGLLDLGVRTVDVVTGAEGALVLGVDRHCMRLLFRSHPGLADQFLEVSRDRKRELPASEQTQQSVDRRLVRWLNRVKDLVRPW